MKILDAGCGPGILAAYLASQGASVTAFDISPKMVELARQRLGDRGIVHLADMSKPLTFVGSGEFDIVASSLAIGYVRDWTMPLKEFFRALKPKGRFVFTEGHPLGCYLWFKPDSAFGVQYVETTWDSFGGEPVVIPDYYRSFEEIINPLLDAGFNLRRVVETRPIEALKEKNLKLYEKYNRIPTFMCLEAVKI
jgi:SAM-dependent methyltransferase